MTDPRRIVVCILLVFAVHAVGGALELDVGAGLTIDVAPFGIESVEPLAIVAPWVGKRDGWQVGLMVAGSLSADAPVIMMALGARAWLAEDLAALYAGIGARVALGESPTVTPLALGGLRLEAGRLSFVAPGFAIRLKPTGLDTEVWLCALWRF
jgi:hypothetical protein